MLDLVAAVVLVLVGALGVSALGLWVSMVSLGGLVLALAMLVELLRVAATAVRGAAMHGSTT